jgi:hypothetical protein
MQAGLRKFDRNWHWRYGLVSLISAIVAANAVGTLIYGALGQSLSSTAGKYSLVLYGVMMLAVLSFARSLIARAHPLARSRH